MWWESRSSSRRRRATRQVPHLVDEEHRQVAHHDARTDPLWAAVSGEVYVRGIVDLNYTPDPAPFAITFTMSYLLAQSDCGPLPGDDDLAARRMKLRLP